MLTISIAAEKIGEVMGFPITNGLLSSWLVISVLTVLSFLATKKMDLVPAKGQLIAEMVVGGLYNFFGGVLGHRVARFFPVIGSLFLFILTSNWLGLLPGFGTVGFREADGKFVPLLRGATADLNTTIALALVSMILVQFWGFRIVGFSYISRFFNFKGPFPFVLGILELISELSKIISFAFRLFGNIFSGEVLLAVIAFLVPYIMPLPFMAMELFVGFIQAMVFSLLTAVFVDLAVSHESTHEGR